MERRKKLILKYRRVAVAYGHPIASITGRIPLARKMLYDRIGPGPHNCHWCNKEIDWHTRINGTTKSGIVADHVDGNCFNDVHENIVPACQQCNGTRFKRVPDKELFIERQGHRHRAEWRTCKSCGIKFLFEIAFATTHNNHGGNTCSKSCAGRLGALAKWS